MSDQASEAPAALTPRLVFDDTEIPSFLLTDDQRKKIRKAVEERAETQAVSEPEESAAITSPETSAAVEAPSFQDSNEIQHLPTEAEIQEPEDMEAVPGSETNLDDMSVEDLQRQQAEIDRKIQEKREAEKRSVIEQIVQVVNTYKIPVDELVEALGGLKVKRKGVKAKPKYRDPRTGSIWTGRGKEPAWIRGKDRKPFEIK